LLDDHYTIFAFVGRQAGIAEKTKVNQLSRALDDERGGKVHINVIGEFEMLKDDEYTNKFWEHLGGKVDTIKSAAEGSDDQPNAAVRAMLQISDESGKIKTTSVPFGRSSLKTQDVFIIDIGSAVFVWVGKSATAQERKVAMHKGQHYLKECGKPAYTTLVRCVEGNEPADLHHHLN